MQYDLTRPCSGRMIDYWLGGNHNLEIDRQVARQIEKQFPIIRQLAHESRALIKETVPYFYERGIRAILDFGASLPTCGNTHLLARAFDSNIKVVYSDIDPITAAYGQELLSDTPNAIYLRCDAANPRGVLDAPETHQLLGTERRVGINFHALMHLLTDEQIRASFQTLYDWAAPGSCLSANGLSEVWGQDPELTAVLESFTRSGLSHHIRSRAQFADLAVPWQLTDKGVVDALHSGSPESPQTYHVFTYSMMLCK